MTEGDLVTQAGGGSQQGVVKSTSNSTTVTLIGVTGTFNTSADLILNGTGTGKTPSNVSTTYTSKPMWTTTIDGGTFWLKKTMNSQNNDVDVNTLIKIYNQKISTLTNQNILLEAKLTTVMTDFNDEKTQLAAKALEWQEKYENLAAEVEAE